ncbi:CAMK/CAMKL/AMPK protein kinase [Phytophthora nicotianae INRA-310]|uniref:CAMK/CAMKL/AMPK protein kinase n=1 Tax=Phytophthora nicotianae (strain INRA-310) TaxID=761204 RepID=W2QL64_PHYN3|nr:CAMK/CAMKL/AMPK protein kinase [Phytophthora nicotianae INRA-310]ETN13661.1 CAMK/CAMKL/AMPK protein kinase [Phytophthora nicotianae INRA-310]
MTANNTNKGNTAVMNPSVPPTPDSPGRKTNIPGKSSPRQKQQVEGVPPNLKTPADQEKQQQQREPERVATETSTASSSTSATGDGKGAVIGEYVLGETIGKGTFGKVKLGLHTLTGEKVAVKILEKKRIVQAADVERVAREIKILKRNRHPNVIQLYEVIDSPDRIFLIMEHIDGGEMFEYIVAHHRIREPEAAFLFRQIVEGLAYLHSNEVTHRDLKPENLLLQSNNHNSRQQQQQATDSTLLVKIVDFGLSNTHDGGRLLRTACGSPCYAAPEMIQGRLYRGPIADMWSLGVVLFAMVCGFLPFEDSNTNMLYKKILSANYKMPTFLSASVQDLIRRILETDPDKRYTVDKILQHPWLAGVQKPDISGYDVGDGTKSDELKTRHKLVLSQLESLGLSAEEVQSALSKKSFNRFTASYYLLDSKLQRLVRNRIIPAPTFGNALIDRSTPSSDNKRQDRLQVRTGGSDARITSSGSAGGSSKTIEVTGTTHRVPESPRRRSNPHHPPQQQHSETQKASAQRSAAPANAAPPRHTGGSGSTQRPDTFARKWKKFSTDRLDKLIVIADFDYTLTPAYTPTDDQALSTHRLLMESEALGPQTETVAREIFEKYFPIEQSAKLTKEEKLPFMIEWWTKTHELMIQHGVSKTAVKKAVEESDITLREGFMDIFDLLARENVPTLIFSAGLYDVIHAVLDKEYAKTPAKTPPKNVHVISNMMRFDENDKVVGFDGTLIHSLNKDASALVETEFWKQCQLEKRHNILLLGDSLGDSNMANGLDFKEDEIVRIGFLNDGADEKLDLYLQRFDVVLTNDSSLLPVELLLHQIQQ